MEEISGLGQLFVTVFLHNFGAFMIVPAITDVTMAALCPGQDECSLAIYLTGFQQAVTGMGSLIVTPLIGNLSDEYGRKALLMVPMTLSIVPLVILAYSRARSYVYTYIVVKTLSDMASLGTVHCIALAYVADMVGETRRGSTFGILSGVSSAAFVCGTLTARLLSTSSAFQMAASLALLSAIYVKSFLPDSKRLWCDSSHPTDKRQKMKVLDVELVPKTQFFQIIPSIEDMTRLLRSSSTFSQSALVAFFYNLGECGIQASLLYYLKAQFHFNKDQFADLLLIAGVAGTTSQLFLMPILAPIMGEEKLLSIGLFASGAHIFLYGIAWSRWVPYVASMFSIMVVFTPPCIRSIASKQVGPDEQGKAQGCISGICSIATIISPLAFTPLTAMFLSETAPFHFPGLSINCIGVVLIIAIVGLQRGIPSKHDSIHTEYDDKDCSSGLRSPS